MTVEHPPRAPAGTMTARALAACSSQAFEQRYRDHADPWNFARSDYEQERYRQIIAALPRRSYAEAYEPGCSVGVLTQMLAPLCGHLVACDVSPTAVARAREHCRGLRNVEIQCTDVAVQMPIPALDLVVFSEVGYYFPLAVLSSIARSLGEKLASGGDFVAAHWLGSSPDHVLHGDEVHAELQASLGLRSIGGSRNPSFRIDVWRREAALLPTSS